MHCGGHLYPVGMVGFAVLAGETEKVTDRVDKIVLIFIDIGERIWHRSTSA